MNNNPKGLIIVSGASSGIGRAMSMSLLTEGYSVLGIAKEFPQKRIKHEKFDASIKGKPKLSFNEG